MKDLHLKLNIWGQFMNTLTNKNSSDILLGSLVQDMRVNEVIGNQWFPFSITRCLLIDCFKNEFPFLGPPLNSVWYNRKDITLKRIILTVTLSNLICLLTIISKGRKMAGIWKWNYCQGSKKFNWLLTYQRACWPTVFLYENYLWLFSPSPLL